MALKWVVVGTDMDGVPGYQVCCNADVQEVLSGAYSGDIVAGISMSKRDMQLLADELNAENEPFPDNAFRGVIL